MVKRFGPSVFVGMAIITLIALGMGYLPSQAMFILGGAAIISYIAWLGTSHRYPVESKGVVALYLGSVSLQIIHLSEEYAFGFPLQFSLLFDAKDWSIHSFLMTFVFAGAALWVAAAAGLLYRIRIANYFVWFYALGAGLINAIAHFVFPILAGGYFPGLYTAPLHLVMSIVLIVALVRETKMLRERRRVTAEEPGRPIVVSKEVSPSVEITGAD